MSDRKKIELQPFHRGIDSNTFTGRPSGLQVRRELDLDSKDKDSVKYQITIPRETTSFNASFFLGLFFDSIKNLKGYDNFEDKYQLVFYQLHQIP